MSFKSLFSFFSIKNKEKLYSDQSQEKVIELKEQNISTNLDKNIEVFEKIYFYPDNSDVKLRNVVFGGSNKRAVIIFINTISDTDIIDEHVLEPLFENKDATKKIDDIISVPSIFSANKIKDIAAEINKGYAALFIDGDKSVRLIDAAKFQGRSIDKPENEIVLKGPKEAFNEKASTNISLIHKKIKNENLVAESMTISKRSRNELYVLYQKDLANEKLLKNIKNRVNSLDIDSVQNLSLLEQHIEERKLSLFPSILYTERPDRASSFLEDGYIVLLMDNSPAALVLPATFWSFYHTSADHYLRIHYGNFTRLLRMLALFITLFTSATYVAITNYHAEMVPPDLLMAIAATREKVPFPSVIEIFMMEFAFELIREAGIRVPTPIGSTIGIFGALILGQAAVQANIVSPIVVIVVALGGLSSFAIGDISMNYAIRLCRFVFLFAASLFGIYGITAVFVLGLFYLVSIKSFGVPYLSPLTPKYLSSGDTLFRRLLKNEILRPGYVKPKDMEKNKGIINGTAKR